MIAAVLLMWLAMLVAGDTPVGRAMRRVAVDPAARWCARRTRGELISAVIMLIGLSVMLWFVEYEGAAMAAPELMGLLASVEFTAAIDALAAVLVAGATGRFASLRSWITARLPARSGRHARTRRVRRATPPASNDDEDPARFAFALAA